MANPVVVYILIAAAFLLLLSTSFHPHSIPKRRGPRRLHHHAAFDPLVDKLERFKSVENTNTNTKLLDVEAFREKLDDEFDTLDYYFAEGGNLNTTERLTYLFPLLDQSPKDEHISYEELEVWNRRQALDRLIYNTNKGMKVHDQNRDGEVTLTEFLSSIPEEQRDWNNKHHGEPGWWKDQFVNADVDDNDALNETEFNDFLHPEDSDNPEVQMWVHKEKIRENDKDEDGKLNLEEFQSAYLYNPDFDTGKDGKTQETTCEQKFEQLDADNDKLLSAAELKPLISQLNNGELSHATYYTKYLIKKADDNKDGKLTLKEMLSHHDAFYNAVYEEILDDNYSDDELDEDDHDEF